MNKEHAREWVEALRSGEYEQGQGYLTLIVGGQRTDCCLGVVCDLAAVPEQERVDWADEREVATVRYEGDPGQAYESTVLPKSAQEWLGVDTSDPVIAVVTEEMVEGGLVSQEWLEGAGVGSKIRATIANDDLGWTFEQIADAVESMYLTD